ncbi:hypothetical protein KFK09_003308 [Dendrobium nobile]|uniref:Uncharacterized protein n=1 Tax=Dendrobium nobile TaxID=94219 RepID=A0A8T3C9R4_DENNO|nr:hypothetical protein KFK09_003308 [Dendrobium nobile]
MLDYIVSSFNLVQRNIRHRSKNQIIVVILYCSKLSIQEFQIILPLRHSLHFRPNKKSYIQINLFELEIKRSIKSRYPIEQGIHYVDFSSCQEMRTKNGRSPRFVSNYGLKTLKLGVESKYRISIIMIAKNR